jgi:hypothetical protein
MRPSPGVNFVAAGASRIVGPAAIVYGTTFAARYTGHDDWIPTTLKSSSSLVLCSLGLAFVIYLSKRGWNALHEALEMRSLGAIRVPSVKGRLPGNIDILQGMVDSYRFEYTNHYFEALALRHGHRFQLNVLADEMVSMNNLHLVDYLVVESD